MEQNLPQAKPLPVLFTFLILSDQLTQMWREGSGLHTAEPVSGELAEVNGEFVGHKEKRAWIIKAESIEDAARLFTLSFENHETEGGGPPPDLITVLALDGLSQRPARDATGTVRGTFKISRPPRPTLRCDRLE